MLCVFLRIVNLKKRKEIPPPHPTPARILQLHPSIYSLDKSLTEAMGFNQILTRMFFHD